MGGGSSQVSETPQEAQEAKNDADLWNYQEQTYQPFIADTINTYTANAASDAQARNVSGQVNAGVMEGVTAAGLQHPINNAVVANKQADNASKMGTSAQAAATEKVKQQQQGNLQNIVDIGRGQQTQAMAAQGQLAGQSLGLAEANRNAAMQVQGAEINAAGSVIGGVAGAALGGAFSGKDSTDLPDMTTTAADGTSLGGLGADPYAATDPSTLLGPPLQLNAPAPPSLDFLDG